MSWIILYLFFVSLHKGISASLADQMAEMTQQCCEQGTAHARTHRGNDCPSAMPPGVHPMFNTLCTYAMDQCCKEHYKKKEACESGIDVATSKRDCSSTVDSARRCCDECLKGSAVGVSRGGSACVTDTRGLSGDQLLAGNAFNTCCQKSASKSVKTDTVTRRPGDAIVTRKPLEDELTSVCDDFAPNELCAHHCIPIPGSYKCECNPGFRLMADKKNCMEVEKNRCKPHNPCQHKCNDNGVSVLCSCRRGYQLMADGKSCEDIDECLLNPPVCLPNTQCVNIQGSYKCILKKTNNVEKGQCPPGFSRNLLNNACDDINECKLPQPPCPSYLCENTVGAYKCGGIKGDPASLPKKHSTTEDQCPPGFKSSGIDDCEDIDECAIQKDDCNKISQFCINTKGSFYCQDKVSKHCPPGFKNDPVTNKCEDINECEEEEDICKPNQVCINLPGEYNCKSVPEISSNGVKQKCADGLRYSAEFHGCVDIDECAEGIHICDQYQTCHNTFGSHECHCNVGFELDTTTGACVDINECATEQNDCIAQSQRCDNTVGSYLCVRFISCGTGYILHHSSSKCEDIDECALGTHNCGRAGPEYRCHNIPGSFRCVRRATTTTSTAAPEYDYEYYDSEEEIVDDNKNNSNPSPDNQPKLDQTSTKSSSTTSESPKETTTSKPPEIKTTLHPDIDIDKPAEIPIDHTQDEDLNNNIYTIDNDKNVPNPEPSQPEITKESVPTSSESIYRIEYTTTEHPRKAEFTPVPSEPKSTDGEDEISYIPIDERPAGPKRTESTEQPGPKYDLDPVNKLPAELPHSKPLDPKDNEIDTYETITKATQPTSPQVVFVEVGKETATVRGEQTPDGSVIVDTNEVPTNEWTKINAKPIDCQFGFERDEYGACYDIDECATNRHICSGLTEICRNTMGGYLCDCAAGFRRDFASKTCVFITWPTSTAASTPTTSTTTTPIPPPPPPPPPTLPPMPPPTLPPTPPSTLPPTPSPTLPTTLSSTPSPTTTPPPTIPSTVTTPPPTPPPTVPITPPPIPSSPLPTTPPTPPPTTERKVFWGYPIRPFTTRPFKPRNICEMGYHFNTSTGTCEDINECTNGQANCATVEICVNTEGGYRCECPPNWELDSRRQRCIPIRNNQHFPQGYGNEPTYNAVGPIHYGTTVRPSKPEVTVEDRVNKCPAGYEVGDDNLCHDVDECLTGEAKCGFMQLCTNLPGGYTCSCPTGYTLVGDHECEDVDECAIAGSIPVCSQNADCINTLGSYQCRCHPGFRAAPRNDKVCIDVDECVENRAGSLCQQRCNNVWGGYRCSCHRGYRLSHDNSSCTDVDECVEFKSRHLCDGKCLNEPGSYRCSCPKGYRLSEDKRSCIDIDECETGEAPCARSSPYAVTSDICVNMRGGYHCHRIICPPGYKIESRHRCTKIDATCAPSDRNCTHQPSTYSYNFITFVSKLYIPDPSVDLFTMKGPVWPTARMRFELKLVEVNAPPTVKERADINSFMLLQRGNNQGVITLVKSLEGPQSIELELSMELYNRGQFAGIAVAKLYIYVSEYEF
ncbi:PREDICTED: fibrillin-1-like [Papilio xuthus]|uniref:Fibrillin-1-like n=1 Tax=Papilio xuthus TaxID=66420 RepID=A0AAJ7EA06_PAPXU|nr:PREDICTED: fibrillin-1-like [Papilio xuthus]